MKITKRLIAYLLLAVVCFMIGYYISRPAEPTAPPAPEPTTKTSTDTERTDKPCRCGDREGENDHDR
jgi:hypothetical protein